MNECGCYNKTIYKNNLDVSWRIQNGTTVSDKLNKFEIRTIILYDWFRFPMDILGVVYGVTIYYNDIDNILGYLGL